MSTTTTNLGLILPADGDSADIQVINSDLQLLDSWVEYDRQSASLMYPGRNIESIDELADEIESAGSVYAFLHARAQANNPAGLRIGDYMNVSAGIYGTRKFELAHYDPYYQMGSTAMGHHFCFVDATPVSIPSTDAYVTNGSYIMWNTTATNQGTSAEPSPYLVSNLHAWEINNFLPALPSELQGYLINRWEFLETRYSASGGLTASTGRAWKQIGKVWSLSEMEVYGAVVWGTVGQSVGIDRQFALFRDSKRQLNGQRLYWWLRVPSGSSASTVCYVNNTGAANYNSAANTSVRPRCGFLLG